MKMKVNEMVQTNFRKEEKLMFKLKIKVGDRWYISLNDYESRQQAEARVNRLIEVGVLPRNIKIVPADQIFK